MRLPPSEIVALLIATSFAAGLNVYATVATLGLLAHTGALTLPAGLSPLGSWYVITASANRKEYLRTSFMELREATRQIHGLVFFVDPPRHDLGVIEE